MTNSWSHPDPLTQTPCRWGPAVGVLTSTLVIMHAEVWGSLTPQTREDSSELSAANSEKQPHRKAQELQHQATGNGEREATSHENWLEGFRKQLGPKTPPQLFMSVGSILAHKGDRPGKSRYIFDLVGYMLYNGPVWGKVMPITERSTLCPRKYY